MKKVRLSFSTNSRSAAAIARTAGALLVLQLAGLASAGTAAACSDVVTDGRVLGVAADGTFVYLRHEEGGGAEGERWVVDVLGPDGGRKVGFLFCTAEESCPRPSASGVLKGLRAGEWFKIGDDRRVRDIPLAVAGAPIPPEDLGRKVAESLHIRPLRRLRARPLVVWREEGTCARIYSRETWGKALLFEIGGARWGCGAMKADLLESGSASGLVFVDYRYDSRGRKACGERHHDVQWISRRRIEAMQLHATAKRQVAKRRYGDGVATLLKALGLEPNYIPSRFLLASAMARGGESWEDAAKTLSAIPYVPAIGDGFYPRGGKCISGEGLQGFDAIAGVKRWKDDPTFEPWLEREFDRHAAAHGTSPRGVDNPHVIVHWAAAREP